MAYQSGIFNDKKYDAEIFQQMFGGLFGNGIEFGVADACQVIADTNMNIKMKQGYTWINSKFCHVTSETTFIVPESDSVYPRIDTIIIRDDVTSGDVYPIYITGTPAANPVMTPLVRDGTYTELCLAKITVGAGVTSILQTDIVDTRADTELCGICQYKASSSNITDFLLNATAQFNVWLDHMKGQLSEDAAGNLQVQIDSLNGFVAELLVRVNLDEINTPIGQQLKLI